MSGSRFDVIMRERADICFSIEELPERFRLTQMDLDDMQRDVESYLRSVPNGSLFGLYGSYRRERW